MVTVRIARKKDDGWWQTVDVVKYEDSHLIEEAVNEMLEDSTANDEIKTKLYIMCGDKQVEVAPISTFN